MKANRINIRRSPLMLVRVMVTTGAMLACITAAARGLQCDPGNQCVTNGMCMPDGTCQGTPLNSGNCDVTSDILCMMNGHCVDGACVPSDPVPDGTSCANGCGTCHPIVPGVPFLTCMPNPAQLGKPCETNLGPCFNGVCTQEGGLIAACIPQPKECPDIDNNPCTADACNPATGMCEHSDAPPCVPQCETCNPATGCQPANIGAACSGFQTECPAETSCQVLAGRGLCLAGTPSSVEPTPTDTPTPTPEVPTPTPPANLCVGDCGGILTVAINNIITLVNIALGTLPASACSNGVPSSGEVNVAVIIQAVNNALNGCPAA